MRTRSREELQLFPFADGTNGGQNELIFEVAEPGGISATFLARVPDATLELGPARREFRYDDSFCAANQLEASERLIHDALLGDRALLTRTDGAERYAPGSWGPDSVDS